MRQDLEVKELHKFTPNVIFMDHDADNLTTLPTIGAEVELVVTGHQTLKDRDGRECIRTLFSPVPNKAD